MDVLSTFVRRGAIALGILVAAAALIYLFRDRIPVYWRTHLRAVAEGVHVDYGVKVPMPDGVVLGASLYRPPGADRPLPTIYIRHPYSRLRYGEGLNYGLFFARHGYAVLVQDTRGKFSSGGSFLPWEKTTEDGSATLDWITRQPWSNGKVGTFGCSALGELQFTLARARHPAHRAMVPIDAGGGIGSYRNRYGYFGVFEGGVFQLASSFGWFVENGYKNPAVAWPENTDIAKAVRTLPLVDMVKRQLDAPNSFEDFLRTPLTDPLWDRWDYVSSKDTLSTPSLVIATWGDQGVDSSIALAEGLREQAGAAGHDNHHLILAPGNHCQITETPEAGRFGELPVANAEQPYRDWYLRWFDHWLKGEGAGLKELPAVLYFTLVENRWREASRWPPEDVQVQKWYLHGGGKANSRAGDGVLAPRPAPSEAFDEYAYDPADPVPSRGGPLCCTGNPADRAGPVDQADVEARKDVLVYTSEPLAQPLRIVGPLRVALEVSSDARDTDFVARLVDVAPDGRALNIQEGALRARYRAGYDNPQPMEPGRRYAITVEARAIAWQLQPGHRLRLQVTSSSFPRLERNLNTGGRNFDEDKGVVAHNRVHHGPSAMSYVELPVLP